MKNIILTASIVSNMFLAVLLYAFTSGHIEKPQTDYLTEISAAAKPVHLSRN
jgi:hypothetical protein